VSGPSETPWYSLDLDGDHLSIEAEGLALRFDRSEGPWSHAIAVATDRDGSFEPVATSLVWDAERDDSVRVAAPVFQELQLKADPDGNPQTLLLGMSGRHHFSGVFTVSRRDGGVGVDVDVVDRCRGEVFGLASTYTVRLDSGHLETSDESAISWSLGSRRLSFSAGASTRLAMAEAGRRATRVQAVPSAIDASPSRRWQYSWTLTSS
jgi:hypothetical protein